MTLFQLAERFHVSCPHVQPEWACEFNGRGRRGYQAAPEACRARRIAWDRSKIREWMPRQYQERLVL